MTNPDADRHRLEITRLKAHHAREIAALKSAQANEVLLLKERYHVQTVRLQNELKRLQQPLHTPLPVNLPSRTRVNT